MRRDSPRSLRAETLQGNREGSAPEETGTGNHSPVTEIVPRQTVILDRSQAALSPTTVCSSECFRKFAGRGSPATQPGFWRSAWQVCGTARMRAKAARSQTTGIGANARGGFLMDFTGHESFPAGGACSRIRSIRPPGFATGGMTRTEPRRIALRRLVTTESTHLSTPLRQSAKSLQQSALDSESALDLTLPQYVPSAPRSAFWGRAFSPSILPVVLRSGRLLFISSHTNDGCGNGSVSLFCCGNDRHSQTFPKVGTGMVVPWRGIRPGLTPRTMLLNKSACAEERIDLKQMCSN